MKSTEKARKPRFSIVIPCYNEELYLGATLKSLKKQDFKGGYEIIVVDNNCTDATAAIAKSHGVTVISESEPGVCWARNAGTQKARGEIIVSTDADTVFDTNWLSRIDAYFERDDRLVMVCGPCQYLNAPWWGRFYPWFLFGTVSIFSKLLGHPYYVTATNVAFKKEAWEGYNTSLTQGGDELGLLHEMKEKGKVYFNNHHRVYTSARRLEKGMWYNIFVSFFFYYLLAYHINKRFNRKIIGTAPVFRQSLLQQRIRSAPAAILVTMMMFVGFSYMSVAALLSPKPFFTAFDGYVDGMVQIIRG